MQPVHWVRSVCALVLLGGIACNSGEDDRPVRWSYIVEAVLRPSCATADCHSTRAARAGVELDDPHRAHVILVGEDGSGDYVVPGDPAASRLIYLLHGQDVRRMPPDLPLPDVDIALIERWILAGARED